MRWDCPHCKRSLETPPPQEGASSSGPQAGWAYARCFECSQFAEVELATGQAHPISAGHRKAAVPPPFKPAAPIAVEPAEPMVSMELAEPRRESISFDEVIRATLETSPDLSDAPSAQVKKLPRIGTLLAYSAALAFTIGVTWLVTAHSAARHAKALAQAAAQPSAGPTQLERAREAAKRLTGEPAPLLADRTPGPPAAGDLGDTIRSAAMAPRRPRPDDIQLYLQARKSTHAMELRTGPGTGYSLLGLADLDERYPVLEVKDRWFRIQLEETPGLSAWVPYERVELFSQDKVAEDKVSDKEDDL